MFSKQLCKHGAIQRFCGRCKEDEDVFWDDTDPRVAAPASSSPPKSKSYRTYAGGNEVQPVASISGVDFVSPASTVTSVATESYIPTSGYKQPPISHPSDNDYSLAREMLRVSGISGQSASSPKEAMEKATLIFHTAPRTGGLTLREFEKARKTAPPQAVVDEILDLGDDHSDMGIPPSLTVKRKKKRKRKTPTVKFEPTPEPVPEPDPEPDSEPELKIFVDEPLDVTFGLYDPFTPESTPTAEEPPPPTEVYHVRGAVAQGSRVLQKIESPQTQRRPLPIAVNSSADKWRGQRIRVPETITAHIKGRNTILKLVKGRVKCICGKLLIRQYSPGPSAWLCASCGCEPHQLPHLTQIHPLWGCATSDDCKWGICTKCKEIPYLRNGMPVWGTDSFLFGCDSDFVDHPDDDAEPLPEKPKPKKKKKKKPAAKKTKPKKKASSSSSSSSSSKKKKKAPLPSGAPPFNNLVAYATSDGYWRVTSSLREEQTAVVVEQGNKPEIERLVHLTVPVESEAPKNKSPKGMPVNSEPMLARSGIDIRSGKLTAVAVLGGNGIHKKISLTESREVIPYSDDPEAEAAPAENRPLTIDEAVTELAETIGLDITYSYKNPTGACYCGGKLKLQTLQKFICSLCDKMKSLLGVCDACGFTKCSDCTNKPDFTKHVDIKREGNFGIAGQYLKSGTNVIAKLDPLIHHDGDVRLGQCLIAINDIPVKNSEDALQILRQRRLEPIPISIRFKGRGGIQLTSAQPHEGRTPDQLGLGTWLLQGDVPGGPDVGITIDEPFDIDKLFIPKKDKKSKKSSSSSSSSSSSHNSLGEDVKSSPKKKKKKKKPPPPDESPKTEKKSPKKKKSSSSSSSSSHDSVGGPVKKPVAKKTKKKPPPEEQKPKEKASPKKVKKPSRSPSSSSSDSKKPKASPKKKPSAKAKAKPKAKKARSPSSSSSSSNASEKKKKKTKPDPKKQTPKDPDKVKPEPAPKPPKEGDDPKPKKATKPKKKPSASSSSSSSSSDSKKKKKPKAASKKPPPPPDKPPAPSKASEKKKSPKKES